MSVALVTHEDMGWRGKLTHSKPRGVRGMAKTGPCVSPLLSFMLLHKGKETTDLTRKDPTDSDYTQDVEHSRSHDGPNPDVSMGDEHTWEGKGTIPHPQGPGWL